MNVVSYGANVTRLAIGTRILFAASKVHALRCAELTDAVPPGGYRARFVNAFRTHSSDRAVFVPCSSIVAILPTKIPAARLDRFEEAALETWRNVTPKQVHRLLAHLPHFDVETMVRLVSDDPSFRLLPAHPDETRLGALLMLVANSYLFRALDDGLYACRPEHVVASLQNVNLLLADPQRRSALITRLADRRSFANPSVATDAATADNVSTATSTSSTDDESSEFPLVSALPPGVRVDGDVNTAFLWTGDGDADVELSLHIMRHVALLRNRERQPSTLARDMIARATAARSSPLNVDAWMRRNGIWNDVHNPTHVDARLYNDVSMPAAPRHYTNEDAVPDDVDAEFRVDFGDTPAYAIDDASTVDVDDAVSVDRDSNGRVWVHVHVADVTSASPLQFGGEADREAARRATSVYFPEKVYPMLPEDFVQHLGLDTKLRSRAGAAALTFSMRLHPQTGLLIEWHVRPTRLPNVQRITYRAVDDVLADRASPLTDGLSRRCANDLRLLDEMAQLRADYRRHTLGALMIQFPRPEVKVDSNFGIHIKTERVRSAASILVEEMMVLAGEVAARAVTSSGVAAPFRTQKAPDAISVLRATVNKANTMFDLPTLFRSLQIPERASTSVDPAAHAGVGLPAYCRATSPLRRYNDTLLHHQLKRIIRSERPITGDEMAPLVAHADVLSRQAKLMERRSNVYWLSVHMKRTMQQTNKRLRCLVLEVRDAAIGDGILTPTASVCILMHDETCATITATFSLAEHAVAPGMRVLAELVQVDVRGMSARVVRVLDSNTLPPVAKKRADAKAKEEAATASNKSESSRDTNTKESEPIRDF